MEFYDWLFNISVSEWIQIIATIITATVAIIALQQTKKQITLSNKQTLFEKRLERYKLFQELLVSAKWYNFGDINEESEPSSFLDFNGVVFLFLTNNSLLRDLKDCLTDEGCSIAPIEYMNIIDRFKLFSIDMELLFNPVEESKIFKTKEDNESINYYVHNFLDSYINLVDCIKSFEIRLRRWADLPYNDKNRKRLMSRALYENDGAYSDYYIKLKKAYIDFGKAFNKINENKVSHELKKQITLK